MITASKRRLIEGAVIAGAGAGILALLPSQVRAIPGLETDMSPAFIPMIVGAALVAVGSILVLTAGLGKQGESAAAFEGRELLRVLLSAGLLLGYTLLFPLFGFLTTSIVFIGVFSYLFGQRSPVRLVAVMAVVPVLVWVLFEIIFVIPLPHGLIF